jgi:hypothetical protein
MIGGSHLVALTSARSSVVADFRKKSSPCLKLIKSVGVQGAKTSNYIAGDGDIAKKKPPKKSKKELYNL